MRLNFKVLATEFNASILAPASPPGSGPVTVAPESMVLSFGISLVDDVDGEKLIQLGHVAFVALATLLVPVCVLPALSFYSQQYVNTSFALASVADPVNAKGVLFGIVLLDFGIVTSGVAIELLLIVIPHVLLFFTVVCICAIDA